MTFLSVSFVFAGLLATLVPIIIHLLSKGKPKKILFPALQFAQARLATNKRKLTLKRLTLLALRVGTLIALGVALARPFFVPQGRQSQTRDASGTISDVTTNAAVERGEAVAAVLVVDSSVRMGRVDNNQTLFERARETARSIVESLPQGSSIAILDGTYEGDAFQPDRFAARTRIDKLEIEPFGRSVAQTTLEALKLVETSPLPSEIYAITDKTQTSWSDRDVKSIKSQLQNSSQKPSLYFVDVGGASIRNASIVDLTLSAETLATDASLRIDVELERIGEGDSELTVETLIFDKDKLPKNLAENSFLNDPKLAVRRETQNVSFRSGRSKSVVKFLMSGLPVGTCVGVVRIVGSDALETDNTRWFAVDVQSRRRLLVVAPSPTESKSLYFTQALAPDELRKTGRAPFELDVVQFDNGDQTSQTRSNGGAPVDLQSATESEIARYAAIFLLDPPGLDESCIKKLTSFVDEGGGLGVFPGRNASPIDAFQTKEATRLLGAKLTTQTRAPGWNREIRPVDYNSPLLAPFRSLERSGVPWDAAPVGRFWNLTELADTTEIVANFNELNNTDGETKNNPPALIENRLGRGLVVTLATPVSDCAQDSPWNALTNNDAPWVFVVLLDGIASRLASNSSSILNYVSGEVAVLRSPLKTFPAVATVLTPSGEEIASPTDVERRQIRFPGARRPGLYRVQTTPNRDGESLDLAFAVSLPSSEFDLTRRSDDDWQKLWEGASFKTLDPQTTSQTLDEARRGNHSEPYSFLVVLLAAFFLTEAGVANRFYRQ